MRFIKHIRSLFKIIIIYVIVQFYKLKKRNTDIWLISERFNEAQDNGYYLYKYIKEHQIHQRVYYIIDKKSNDFQNVKMYDTVIQHNSLKHYFYYFLAQIHISAFQFFGVPDNPLIWKMEELGFFKKKRVFIQHGITKEELPFLKYENTKYDLFICGAKPEYQYIKDKFNYPTKNVKYLGFSRFDVLHDYKEKKQILLMPTWRQWIGMTSLKKLQKEDYINFLKTEYFKKYNSLLKNKMLIKILDRYDYKLYFYLHPEMQKYKKLFLQNEYSSRIIITSREEYNLQSLLKESKILITDYSSIAFDAGYMKKDVLYYQFDQEKYYENHFNKGYFDCESHGFGPIAYEENQLINDIKSMIVNSVDRDIYFERSDKFFEIYDCENSRRIYEAINEI